ncbi:pre-mycofactocin synthase MftD [Ferrimicrobium acidiphilum]|uniref:pre-mycofactocin synthase MftD n=1 Tax=Ferrimicrobium acidiphilum TaxID=121039 RepID=UPI0023F4FCEF|nr:pre-mycofactocin synthase MftD [Ferrimicrobium acidiphilum]
MSSTRTWFESVAEAERRAQRALPPSVFAAIRAGAESGVTLSENVLAFSQLQLLPTVADLPSDRELATTVMGMPVSLPVLLSPTGVQAVHPDGELAVARAAKEADTIMGVSAFASSPVEAIAQVTSKFFYQTYWTGTREMLAHRLERARAAGACGLIVTLDWCFDFRRDWGSPWIPQHLDARAIFRYLPELVRRPEYVRRYLATGGPPDLGVPNMADLRGEVPGFFTAFEEWMRTPPPTWEDIAWLRAQWGGAFMIKGITRVDDARKAKALGVTAISVSNHGGNNLDSTPATIRCLPAIVDAVGDDVEILLDGGIRRGSDVVKALALGARAVMIGRPYLWGLAASGSLGVTNVLEILRAGVSETLYALGKRSIMELERTDVLVPDGFVIRSDCDNGRGR